MLWANPCSSDAACGAAETVELTEEGARPFEDPAPRDGGVAHLRAIYDRHADEVLATLNLRQFAAAMHEAGFPVTFQQANSLMKLFDLNADGQISFKEFRHAVSPTVHVDACVSALRAVRASATAHAAEVAGYAALAKYVVLVTLLLLVVMLQQAHAAAAASVVGAVSTILGGAAPDDGFADAASIVGFLGDVVDTVFADAECGDGVCSRPEEYPSWLPGGDDGAARAFDPCRADCGELNASALVYARVTFADTEKLANAHEAWAAFSDAGYNGYTPSSWGVDAQARVAGWNVCARDKREYGYLVSVCVFDGHGDGGAFIDGLPYRTTELACATSAVAGKHGTTYSASCPGGAAPALALFEGNWELRVDFSGWEMNALFDLAYPAVGGYLQFQRAPSAADDGDPSDDALAAGWSGKEWFSPCPHAPQCRAQFVRGDYYYDCEAHAAAPCVNNHDVEYGPGFCESRLELLLPGLAASAAYTFEELVATDFCSSGDIYYDWCAYVFAPGCSQALGLCDDDDGGGGGGGGAPRWHDDDAALLCSRGATSPDATALSATRDAYVTPNVYPNAALPARALALLFATGGFNYTGESGLDAGCYDWCDLEENLPTCVGHACAELMSDDVAWFDCADESIAPLFCARACGYCDNTSTWEDRYVGNGRREASAQLAASSAKYWPPSGVAYGSLLYSKSDDYRDDFDDWAGYREFGARTGDTRSMDDAMLWDDEIPRWPGAAARAVAPADGQCDRRMNNIFWRFDKGDCCLSTCAPESSLYDATCAFWGETVGATAAGGPRCTGPAAILDMASASVTANGTANATAAADDLFDDGGGDDDGESTVSWDYCLTLSADPSATGLYDACSTDAVRSGSAFFAYPFTTWRAMIGIMSYYEGEERVDRWRLPSMACPDCAVAAGGNVSHLAIPFALDASTLADPERPATIGATSAVDVADAFPGLGAMRRRTVGGNNLVVVGPLLYQRRTELRESCDAFAEYFLDEIEDAGLRCADPDGAASRTAVGVDATVDPSAPAFSDADPTGVYRADLGKAIGAGFSYDQGSGRVGDVQYPYPVLFDVNFNHSKARQLVTYVDWGKYIGTATAELALLVVTYNPEAGLWAVTEATWTPAVGGVWEFEQTISVVSLDMYYSDADKLRAALELLFLLVVAFFVLVEVCEIVEAARDGTAGLAEYCGSMTNVLDIATYVALTTAVSMWCSVYFGDALDELRPETLSPRVGDVYAEFFATGEGAGLVEMGAAGQARYEAFFGAITSVVEALNEYQTVVSVALMLTLGQLIAKLGFHPKLGIISRTLDQAKVELLFFFALFLVITVIFTVLAYMLFGRYFPDEYGTVMTAFENTLIILMVGAPDSYGDMAGTNQTLGVLTRLWYWLYIAIIFFIMLNALLAIIVKAYDEVSAISPLYREPLRAFARKRRAERAAPDDERALYLSDAALDELLALLLSGAEERQRHAAAVANGTSPPLPVFPDLESERQARAPAVRGAHDGAPHASPASPRSSGFGQHRAVDPATDPRFVACASAYAAALCRADANDGHAAPVQRALASLRADDLLDFERDEDALIFSVEGVRVGAPALRRVFLEGARAAGAPEDLAGVAAVNVMLRLGVPSGELSDEDLESTKESEYKRRLVVAALAFMLAQKGAARDDAGDAGELGPVIAGKPRPSARSDARQFDSVCL